MGDKVIQTVGKTIISSLELSEQEKQNISNWDFKSPHCLAGRLGGDEFIIFVRGMKSRAGVVELIQKMLNSLNAVRFDGVNGIHASFGVTEISKFDKDIDNAYKRADEALYESKRAGKNQIHFSTETVPGDA